MPAPSDSAIRTDRSSLATGSAPHTRCEISRHGACTAWTGTAYLRTSAFTTRGSWLDDSAHTINSMPS